MMMVGLLEQAFLVGKDFEASPAFLVVGLHPERVSGVITLGIPFMPPGVSVIPFHLLPKGFYLFRWQVSVSAVIITFFIGPGLLLLFSPIFITVDCV